MSDLIKLVLSADFLLFMLSIFGVDIAGYIQKKVTTCNPKIFGFAMITFLYILITKYVP